MLRDTVTHTEHQAGLFNRDHAPYPIPDRPTLSDLEETETEAQRLARHRRDRAERDAARAAGKYVPSTMVAACAMTIANRLLHSPARLVARSITPVRETVVPNADGTRWQVEAVYGVDCPPERLADAVRVLVESNRPGETWATPRLVDGVLWVRLDWIALTTALLTD